MKIHIDQIPDAGLNLTESCQSADLDLNKTDIKFTEPINLSARVSKGIGNISIGLKIDALMHLSCSRCVEEFTLPLSKKVNLNISTKHRDVIDLTDNLRQEIILNYPLKPLCCPDCQGLCTTCGQNLNKGRCNHGSS